MNQGKIMKAKKWLSILLAVIMCLTTVPVTEVKAETKQENGYRIVTGTEISELQEYAAKELQRYLFQLSGETVEIVTAEEGMDVSNAFVLGTKESNALRLPIEAEFESLGEQGYVLKKAEDTLYIGGYDDEGVLYGVYGLLDDHYGIGFYFSGDVIPETKTALTMPEVDETKTPRQYMRGVLPWTNFPQSATVYSDEDWKFVIDQMARMRMNFLNIHNYNGMIGHNEMFHNFTFNGITSRNWNATARNAHKWGMSGWDVNKYRFGGTDLFDDYDFGTNATLHNDCLDNNEVFAKGYSQFQTIIDYAHSRGVKVGLGLDIDLIMPDYGVEANTPGVPEAQAKSVLEHYKDLDTFILYTSENLTNNPGVAENWKQCFTGMYDTIREEAPDMQIAVSGWGINKNIADWVPDDVVIAPISKYEAGMVNGQELYGDKEYWGGPWVERDFNSSVYFYPFNIDLEDTIRAYQINKDHMEGMFTLSWRLTDAVDAKMSYIAKAPWDLEEKYQTAADVYGEYAEKCYGSNAADMTKLICDDEKTVVPTLWSECNQTPGFSGNDRSADVQKLQTMIDRVDAAISEAADNGNIARLNKLRDRLVGAQYYCKLDWKFNSTPWEELQDDFSVWARAFMTRVDDISSLGNNQSVQNRFVQRHYVARETALRNAQEVKAPVNAVAKGTSDGAVLTWEYEKDAAEGFHVYRDGEKITGKMLNGNTRSYDDTFDGTAVYTVTAVNAEGTESVASIPQSCEAGNADVTAPQAIVVSPFTSVRAGQKMVVKARVLDERAYDELSAKIHYRAIGEEAFISVPMEWRTKTTFVAAVDTAAFADSAIEYYITVSDGKNTGYWPVTAKSGLNASCTVYTDRSKKVPLAPTEIDVNGTEITWEGNAGDFWYKIYRGDTPDFTPSPANYVTYVEQGTKHFRDMNEDFDGSKLSDQTKYYRITAVDKNMNESIPSLAVAVNNKYFMDPLTTNLFAQADEYYRCRPDVQPGSSTGQVAAYIENGGYAKFETVNFPTAGIINTVDVSYATDTPGGKVEVWLDAPGQSQGGKKAGEAEVGNSGGWGNFKKVSITLEPEITGTHDLYFVFSAISGSTQYLFNLDTFRFKHMESTEDDIVFTTNDMMAFKESVTSDMQETKNSITNFGNEGDKVVLGKGFRADAENAGMGGATRIVELPGYGVPCFAYFGAVGDYFRFENVPGGKAYLAYDRDGRQANGDKLAMYVNGEKKSDVALPHDTGSYWGHYHHVMYAKAGVLAEGDNVKFNCDEPCSMNGIKLFVEQEYSAGQMEIFYANNADTQFSVYADGVKQKTITLPNTSGQSGVCRISLSLENAVMELRVDAEDLEKNNGAKATIEKIVLGEEKASTKTITVTAGEGGTVEPAGEAGVVTVEAGADQTFEFTPEDGYVIEKVLVNGADYGVISSYTFEDITYDATLEVKFAKSKDAAKYQITIDEITGAEITVSHTEAQAGEPVTVTLTPEEGYVYQPGTLKYVTASNPEGVLINEISKQFSMPTEDVMITAAFEKPLADYTKVNAAIADAKTRIEEQYTEESWSALEKAIADVKENLGANEQETVDAMADAISEAMNALVLKNEGTEQSSYTVTVENGTLENGDVSGTYEYNAKAAVKAAETENGMNFIGWRVNDGGIVSTEKDYAFYVAGNMKLTAVYAEEEVMLLPEAQLTNVLTTKRADGKYDVKFVAQLTVPEGCTVREAGLVWSSNDDVRELGLDAGLKETYITKISDTNQFSVTIKGMPAGKFLRGRIFAVIEDTNDKKTAYYSAEKRAVTEKADR